MSLSVLLKPKFLLKEIWVSLFFHLLIPWCLPLNVYSLKDLKSCNKSGEAADLPNSEQCPTC